MPQPPISYLILRSDVSWNSGEILDFRKVKENALSLLYKIPGDSEAAPMHLNQPTVMHKPGDPHTLGYSWLGEC